MPGYKKSITPELVHAEALAYLDEVGLANFSLRVLATRLGITSPALQYHIGSREKLMIELVDLVVAGIELPAQDELDPFDWLRRAAMSINRQLGAKPNTIPLVRDFGDAAPAMVEIAFRIGVAFMRAGLRGRPLKTAIIAFLTYVFGHVYMRSAVDSAMAWEGSELGVQVARAEDDVSLRYPELVDALRDPVGELPVSPDQMFSDGLDALLAGVRQQPAPAVAARRRAWARG